MRRAVVVATLAALALGGCAGLPAPPAAQAPGGCDASGPLGPPQATFDIDGRIALRQGQRTDHLRFTWRHTADSDQLTLDTALGQGLAQLVRHAGGATLSLADGRQRTASDWRGLARDVLGDDVPLDELPEWLRGARPEREGVVGPWHVTVSAISVVADPASLANGCRRLPRLMDIESEHVALRLLVDGRGEP